MSGTLFQTLVRRTGSLFDHLRRVWPRELTPQPAPRPAPAAPQDLQPLARVVLTDGVGRTLFEEYAAHRAEARGEEETGWVLLGLRNTDQAVVLGTLPAGAARDAGVAHVQFNSNAQELGSRIVRQVDRRLHVLGVVHTHPGSLRHPSDADFRGDSQWVHCLRGREGVFAIGTADGHPANGAVFAEHPRPHVQALGELRLSWYALRHGEAAYRPLPVELTLGPDLARPLHAVWDAVETHAERLDRLYRQLAGVTFQVIEDEDGPALAVNVPLVERDGALRVVVHEKRLKYYLVRGGELLRADCPEDRVDRGVYLLLAELAAGDS
jgi:proteasome lid subunit RPN8/RPN11